MKLTLKWPVVIITFIITLSLFWGANYWRQQNLVMQPLREELLSLEFVQDVQIEGRRDKKVLVYMGQVPHLALAYRDLQHVLQSRNEDSTTDIQLVDKRDDYLNSLWEKIHLAVMEGERQGSYTKMYKEISLALADEERLTEYSVTVDQERIYLKLMTGDAYLYEIVAIKHSTPGTHNAGI